MATRGGAKGTHCACLGEFLPGIHQGAVQCGVQGTLGQGLRKCNLQGEDSMAGGKRAHYRLMGSATEAWRYPPPGQQDAKTGNGQRGVSNDDPRELGKIPPPVPVQPSEANLGESPGKRSISNLAFQQGRRHEASPGPQPGH